MEDKFDCYSEHSPLFFLQFLYFFFSTLHYMHEVCTSDRCDFVKKFKHTHQFKHKTVVHGLLTWPASQLFVGSGGNFTAAVFFLIFGSFSPGLSKKHSSPRTGGLA